MSLKDPSVKMSKSDPNPSSRILINDSASSIKEKIRMATTDDNPQVTADVTQRLGVANLLRIEAAMTGNVHAYGVDVPAEDYARKECSLGALKGKVANLLIDHFGPIRERFEHLMSEEQRGYLAEVAEEGARKASVKATQTMTELRAHLGMGSLMDDGFRIKTHAASS